MLKFYSQNKPFNTQKLIITLVNNEYAGCFNLTQADGDGMNSPDWKNTYTFEVDPSAFGTSWSSTVAQASHQEIQSISVGDGITIRRNWTRNLYILNTPGTEQIFDFTDTRAYTFNFNNYQTIYGKPTKVTLTYPPNDFSSSTSITDNFTLANNVLTCGTAVLGASDIRVSITHANYRFSVSPQSFDSMIYPSFMHFTDKPIVDFTVTAIAKSDFTIQCDIPSYTGNIYFCANSDINNMLGGGVGVMQSEILSYPMTKGVTFKKEIRWTTVQGSCWIQGQPVYYYKCLNEQTVNSTYIKLGSFTVPFVSGGTIKFTA